MLLVLNKLLFLEKWRKFRNNKFYASLMAIIQLLFLIRMIGIVKPQILKLQNAFLYNKIAKPIKI